MAYCSAADTIICSSNCMGSAFLLPRTGAVYVVVITEVFLSLVCSGLGGLVSIKV